VDAAGRTALSLTTDVVVRASGLTLTSPVNDAVFAVGDAVSLHAEGTAPAPVARVEFRMDGTVIGVASWVASGGPDGSAGIARNATPAGSHVITATMVLTNGMTLASVPVPITVRAPVPPPPPPPVPPPVPEIVLPGVDGATVPDYAFSLAGTVQNAVDAVVFVNGQRALLDTATGRFFADVALTPGTNTITVTLFSSGNDPVTRVVHVTGTASPAFQFTLNPTQGLAPLTVTGTLQRMSNVAFKRIEITSRADLVPDVTWYSLDTPGTVTYRASTAGVWTVRVRVFDAGEHVIYDATRHVLVQDPQDLAGKAVQTFETMRSALRGGNIGAALATITADMQAKYSAIFSALQPDLPTIADQLGTVQEVTVNEDMAEIVLLRSTSAGDRAFNVYVIRSEDGVWRIDGM
jgi:hypothetical protein